MLFFIRRLPEFVGLMVGLRSLTDGKVLVVDAELHPDEIDQIERMERKSEYLWMSYEANAAENSSEFRCNNLQSRGIGL